MTGFVPPPYPYERLDEITAIAAKHDGGAIDLSIGTPCDPPPADVVAALSTSNAERGYPPSIGTPALREAISREYADAKSHPSDAARAGKLGRLLQAWEQWGAAHEAYTRAAVLAPATFEWRYLDACVQARLARPAEAAARFKEALAIRPDYLPARVKLADALLDSGRLEESRRMFAGLVGEAAAEPQAVFGLGRLAAAEAWAD